MRVDIVRGYLAAFLRGTTYNPRRNPYLGFGLLWGLPVPAFSIGLDLSLGAPGRTLLDALGDHPVHVFFLLHPLLFAAVFGAMGTLRHDLAVDNEKLIAELTSLATIDPLTGVSNRRVVMEDLQRSVQRGSRGAAPFAVVLFDLDHFKRVNDERGHLAGDEILRRTGAALQKVVRQGDVLGRYGGDEFLLVTHGTLESPEALADRARHAVQAEAGIGVTAGISRYPRDGAEAAILLEAADRDLAQQKRNRGTGRRSAPDVHKEGAS